MKEIWKDIQGFEGLYQVSNFGNIFNVKRNTERKLGYDRYIKIRLCKENKKTTIGVHRLVALHFLENPDNKPYVCHKDNNPHNNHFSNLYWGTQKENIQQAVRDGRR
jgi:hypothetical protein